MEDFMKKIIAIVLSILTVFSFVSCADNKLDPPETTGNGPEVTTEPETTEAPVGEYVLRHKYADIDEVLDRPEIEVDRSRLKDFYMLVEDYESFRSIDNLTEMAISVKGSRARFAGTRPSRSMSPPVSITASPSAFGARATVAPTAVPAAMCW